MPDLILALLNYRKGTLSSELRQFAKALNGQDALRPITASAFCQARMKLRPEALIELNRVLIKAFEQQVALRHWQGFRVLAVDGVVAGLKARLFAAVLVNFSPISVIG